MSADAISWVERTLLHNEIYFASAASFNDPFELRPVFSLDASPERQREEYLRSSNKFQPEWTDDQREAEADLVMANSMSAESILNTSDTIQMLHAHVISESVGIYCVSSKKDDVLMWSHYADSHRGICLEFDGSSPLMKHAQEVIYSSSRVPLNPYDDNQDTMMTKALLTKSAQWSYEAEWRLCRYRGGPGVVKFHPANLTGIIIGALATRSTVEIMKRWLKERSSPVSLHRASVSNKVFKLNINAYT
jgi:hypothetical protein